MKPLELTIRNERGYLFAGKFVGTVAFVPFECVTCELDGRYSIDELSYFQTQWSSRNMRYNVAETNGTQLFPDPDQPLTDANVPEVKTFLRRMRQSYGPVQMGPAEAAWHSE